MNATNFVESISQIIPDKQELLRSTNFSEDSIDQCLKELHIHKKVTHTEISPLYPVLDLIFNYDLSNLCIQNYKFNEEKDIVESDQFIYVGWVEAFLIAISKETGEIVETDWEAPNFIVSYIAKDQSSFLDALVELEKLSLKRLFQTIAVR